MNQRDVIDFLMLSALWGASFLFMRLGVPGFGPVALILLRCAIGALTLLPVLLWWHRDAITPRGVWLAALFGVINSSIPFTLLAFAALSLSAGMLSTLNATAPFWGAMIAFLWLREHITRWQVLGMLVGFTGVYFLVDADPQAAMADPGNVLIAVIAALGATLVYGLAANMARRYMSDTDPLVNATVSQAGAAAVLLIPGILLWPETAPGLLEWSAAIMLGVFSSGLAFILYFRLIRNVGSSRAITVTFAIPVFGMFFGWLFLGEAVTTGMLLAAGVILFGCALATRAWDPSKTRAGGPATD